MLFLFFLYYFSFTIQNALFVQTYISFCMNIILCL